MSTNEVDSKNTKKLHKKKVINIVIDEPKCVPPSDDESVGENSSMESSIENDEECKSNIKPKRKNSKCVT
jgi:hypothetical protein